jgi:hypothetical protein
MAKNAAIRIADRRPQADNRSRELLVRRRRGS